jgi:hypothetical protein
MTPAQDAQLPCLPRSTLSWFGNSLKKIPIQITWNLNETMVSINLRYGKLYTMIFGWGSWIPHELSDQNRKERVEAFQKNLAKFQEGKLRLCHVITGDKSRFDLRQIGHKLWGYSERGTSSNIRTILKFFNFFYVFFSVLSLNSYNSMKQYALIKIIQHKCAEINVL